MCHFISWIDLEGQLYYLTSKELHSKRGKELKKYLGSAYAEDVVGHGAIDWFFDLKGRGVHKECTDFSSPDNFPDEIVRAIKSGAFKSMGVCPEILNLSALAEYEKIEQSALAECEKIEQSALAEYEKVKQPAKAEYEKVTQPAWAEYGKIVKSALAEYKKIEQSAKAECDKISQSAWAEYKKIEQSAKAECEKISQSAWAECEKIEQDTFWRLVIDAKNRSTAWA